MLSGDGSERRAFFYLFIFNMKEQKKPVGAPAKPDEEKQTAFTVSCKKKNLETIKPKVKALIKRLDK